MHVAYFLVPAACAAVHASSASCSRPGKLCSCIRPLASYNCIILLTKKGNCLRQAKIVCQCSAYSRVGTVLSIKGCLLVGGMGDKSRGRVPMERSASPLHKRKGLLPPVNLPNSNNREETPSEPIAAFRLPTVGQGQTVVEQHHFPSPLRSSSALAALERGATDICFGRSPPRSTPSGSGQHRRGSLSPARRSGVVPRIQRSPEPIQREGSSQRSSSADELPPIANGNGALSSSSSESLGDSNYLSTSSCLRTSRMSGHISGLKEFSSLSRSLPSLMEEEDTEISGSHRSAQGGLHSSALPRSGSVDDSLGSSFNGELRLRHRHHSSPASRSLAGMASPMSSRRRVKPPPSPTPLCLGDLSPDMAVGMLYSRESPSMKRRTKTVSPEPIPEDVVAPSPTVPRRRSPSPQPQVHASGIPVSPLATGGPPQRHVSLPAMSSSSPRRSRPNNVCLISRSISPARASSLDSADEQGLMSLSPVKELEADDEDSTDGPGGCGSTGRSNRSRSLGEVEVPSQIVSHMPKSLTLDDLKTGRHTLKPPTCSIEDIDEAEGDT